MNEPKRARSAAAVLVLIKKQVSGERCILLIERSATVKTHQSQVAFPGGGFESQDAGDPIATALRECHEEVGIVPDQVRVLKTLPPLPTLTSGFFVHAVMGELIGECEPPLSLDFNEVAHADWVSVGALLDTRRIENGFPVFDWVNEQQKVRKVWGLTAIIFDLLFRSDAESV